MSALKVTAAPTPMTLQDLGRSGYQRSGFSGAGAMDPFALQVVNILVGNAPNSGAIELTLGGGSFEVQAESVRLAVLGAATELSIDGKAADTGRTHTLKRGQVLKVGSAKRGAWSYLAVAGGYVVPMTLGSMSTHTRAQVGGIDGGPLNPGTSVPLAAQAAPGGNDSALPAGLVVKGGFGSDGQPVGEGPVRVVFGPQDDYFTKAGIETFLSSTYQLTAQADRMGYRLTGPKVEHLDGYNIVSDGNVAGSIQIPGAGEPIVLMADRGSTGGYPKIATVISIDFGRLSQRRPGEAVNFAAVTLAESHELLKARAAFLKALPGRLVPVVDAADLDSETLLSTNLIDGVVNAAE